MNSRSTRPPTNRLLTEAKEQGIVSWLEYIDKLGIRATLQMLKREINWMLARRGDNPPLKCGEGFASRLISRYPHLALRKENLRDLDREIAEDVHGLQLWYSEWK
jgi:hypothetical protein